MPDEVPVGEDVDAGAPPAEDGAGDPQAEAEPEPVADGADDPQAEAEVYGEPAPAPEDD